MPRGCSIGAGSRTTLVAGLAVLAIAGGASFGRGGTEDAGSAGTWRTLEPGLEFGEFLSPRTADVGDSRVRALRIDPARFELRLLNASAPDQGQPLTARQWCRRAGLAAATNASMYQADLRTSVSLMRTREHVNNPRLTRHMAVLAFDVRDAAVPPVQIIDRECQDFARESEHYGTLVQSIRMISCHGRNVWSPQPKKWSTALVGTDHQGRVLFIHVRSPYATHDLIEILLALPLGLARAMYVEGGPEAQLYVASGDREFVGSYETGFNENDDQGVAWPVPNVLGIVPVGSSPAATRPR